MAAMASSMAPPPTTATRTVPTSASDDQPLASNPAPQIHTYHCHCSTLLLASSTPLTSLPTRAPHDPSTSATIVPLPPPPRDPSRSPSSSSSASASSDVDDHDEGDNVNPPAQRRRASPSPKKRQQEQTPKHYALLLHALLDRKPVMVTLVDGGFEKRWVWRCGRCRVVVGYGLDGVHFSSTSAAAPAAAASDGENGGDDAAGRGRARSREGARSDERDWREKVVYILPGGVVSSDDMVAGKGRGEKDIGLGLEQ